MFYLILKTDALMSVSQRMRQGQAARKCIQGTQIPEYLIHKLVHSNPVQANGNTKNVPSSSHIFRSDFVVETQ